MSHIEFILDENSMKFVEEHNINHETMKKLGSGGYGTAYSLGDGRVLKITKSPKEYKLSKKIIEGDYPHLVSIYASEEIGDKYFLLMEELTMDSKIQLLWYELDEILETQEMPVQYLGHFDFDEYEEEYDIIISDDMNAFILTRLPSTDIFVI